MCRNKEFFTNFVSSAEYTVTMASGQVLPVEGTGTIEINTNGSSQHCIRINNVYYIPGLKCN